jgi:hypothetical protein
MEGNNLDLALDILKGNSLSDMGNLLTTAISVGADPNCVFISSLKFYANVEIAVTKVNTFSDAVKYQIPILDWLQAVKLQRTDSRFKELKFTANTERINSQLQLKEYASALAFATFLIVVRNKYWPDDEKEEIPAFAKKYLGFNMKKDLYLSALTVNDIRQIPKDWVKSVDMSCLPVAMVNRMCMSVAGYRNLNALLKHKERDDLDARTKEQLQLMRSVAERGPFWEGHPIDGISSNYALSKNAMGLIKAAFSEEVIKEMVAEKSIFSAPNKNNLSNDWKGWDGVVYRLMRTPIFPHLRLANSESDTE